MLSRHALLWFVVLVLITCTATSNVLKSTLHPQVRSSNLSPANKLLSASNGLDRQILGTTRTASKETKPSAAKHNFEKQTFVQKSTRFTTTKDEKLTTAKQNIDKVGLIAARKNPIHINLNKNFNQPRRNMQKSILNTQIQIISNYPNPRNARTNNIKNPAPSRLSTARPQQDNISNKNSGLSIASMNHNLPGTGQMSVGHMSNSDPNKPSNYDANMLDYKKVADGKIKIRKHQAIISNAARIDKTIPNNNIQSKKTLSKPPTPRSSDVSTRSTSNMFLNIAGTEPPSAGGITLYSRNTDPLHAFFPDYANPNSPSTSSPKNMTTDEEPLDKTGMNAFREKMKRAVTLNDNKDIPPFLFRCLPNEVIDCESDENYNYVVDSLLQKPESVKDDLDLMLKIYTRLQQVNITWPEGYVFNEREFATLANDSMVTTDVKTRPQSDELSVVKKYKFVREIFSTVAGAKHKPGDIFITDVIREIIKIKSVFVKRKILDLLFYKVLHPGYVDEKQTDHNDDDVTEVPAHTTTAGDGEDKDISDVTDTPHDVTHDKIMPNSFE